MVQFSRDGRIVRPGGAATAASAAAAAAAASMSRFEEDVFPGNHTSVWGSWYDKASHSWGYACCHATMKTTYCTGESF